MPRKKGAGDLVKNSLRPVAERGADARTVPQAGTRPQKSPEPSRTRITGSRTKLRHVLPRFTLNMKNPRTLPRRGFCMPWSEASSSKFILFLNFVVILFL